MDDSTVEGRLTLNAGATVRGSDNIFTGSGAVIWLSSPATDMSSFFACATADDAYVGINAGNISSSIRYAKLGERLGTYLLSGNSNADDESVRVKNGGTLFLGEGACLRSTDYEHDLIVESGGRFEANGARLEFTGHDTSSYKRLTCLNVLSGGTAVLTDTEVVGDAEPSNWYLNSEYATISVASNASLALSGCTLTDVHHFLVQSGSTVSINGTTLQAMYLYAGTSLSGKDNVFTDSGRVIALNGPAVDMGNFQASATAENAYIGVYNGSISTYVRYTKLGEGLSTYRLLGNSNADDESVRVKNGGILFLGEGACLLSTDYEHDLIVESGGRFEANGARLEFTGHDTSSYKRLTCLNVLSGGTAVLTDTEVVGDAEPSNWYLNSEYATISVASNASLALSGCTLTDVHHFLVQSGSTVSINGTTLQAMYLYEGTSLSGKDNVFTDSGRVIALNGPAVDMGNFQASATAENAYIGVYNGSISTYVRYTKLGEGLSTYRLLGNSNADDESVRVKNGGTLFLGEGATLRSTDYEHDLIVNSGGRFEASGARLELTGSSVTGSYTYLSCLEVQQGGTAVLTDTEVVGVAATGSWYDGANYDTMRVQSGGSMTLSNCQLQDVTRFRVESGAELRVDNTTLQVLCNQGSLMLNESELQGQLTLGSGATISGSGNIFTKSGSIINLASASVDMSNFRIAGALEDAYVSVTGTSIDKTVAWVALSDTVRKYVLPSSLTISAAGALTLDAGMEGSLNQVSVYGTLTVTEEADVALAGNVTVYQGGTVNLAGAEIQGKSLTLQRGATADITGCRGSGTLTISGGAAVNIQGNDFSGIKVKLNNWQAGDEMIDLSGNYWGTTDMDAIAGMISGYSSNRVFIGYVLSEPPAEHFSYAAEMIRVNKVSLDSTVLRVMFNKEVDAGTLAAGIHLVDAGGTEWAISGFEVQGKEVRLRCDALPEGRYTLRVDENLKDVSGESFRASTLLSGGIIYDVGEILAPKVLLVRCNSTVTDQFNYFELYFDQQMESGCLNASTVGIRDSEGQELAVTQVLQGYREDGLSWCRVYFDAASSRGNHTIYVDSSVAGIYGNPMTEGYEYEVYVASPDLSVPGLVECSTQQLGRKATISYTVQNIGDGEIRGSWVDSVYLCPTEEWDASQAILLGRVNSSSRTIAGGKGYTGKLSVLLDGLVPGEYHLFVELNSGNSVSEVSRGNNISATGTRLELSAVTLNAEGETSEVLGSANEKIYYSFTATESTTYCFNLNTATGKLSVAEELYPGQGASIGKKFTENGRTQLYFEAEAGKTYYILAEPGKKGTYTASVEETHFELLRSSLKLLAPGRSVTVHVYGTCFSANTQFYLQAEDGTVYQPTATSILSGVEGVLTFQLPEEATSGMKLTLYATDPAVAAPVALEQELSVATYADTVHISFSNMNGEGRTGRVGWVWKADLSVANKAGYDVENAIILVTDTAEDFAMYYSYEDAKVRDRSALLLNYGNKDETKGILSAEESEKLGVYVKHYRAGSGSIQAWLLSPDSQVVISPERWAQLESALRPAGVSDADWAAWWGDMQPRIGDTEADFVAFIQGMQQHVLDEDSAKPVSAMPDLVMQIMDSSATFLPAYAVRGCLQDSLTGEAWANSDIFIYLVDSEGGLSLAGETTTKADGSYVFYGVSAGSTYVIKTDAQWDMNQDQVADNAAPSFTVNSGDVLFDGYIQPISPIELNDSHSSYSFLTGGDNVSYRLWNHAGYTAVAHLSKDGQWSEGLLNDSFDTSATMIWSDSLQALVVAWKTGDGIVYRLGKNVEDTMMWSEERLVPLLNEVRLLGVHEDGKNELLFMTADALTKEIGIIRQPVSSVMEEVTWKPLFIPLEEEGETYTEGSGYKVFDKKFDFSPPKGVIGGLLRSIGFKGNASLSAEVFSDKATFSAGGNISSSYGTLKSYSSASWTGSLGVSVSGDALLDRSDCPTEIDFKKPSWSGHVNLSVKSRLGLLNLLGRLGAPGAALSAALKRLNSFLKKHGASLHAGYTFELDCSGSNVIKGVPKIGIDLGIDSKKSNSWALIFSPSISVTYEFDPKSWHLDISDIKIEGDLVIRSPQIMNNQIVYEGSIADILNTDLETTGWKIERSNSKRAAEQVGESILAANGDVVQLFENHILVHSLSDGNVKKLPYSFRSGMQYPEVEVMQCHDGSFLLAGIGVDAEYEVMDAQSLTFDQVESFFERGYQSSILDFALLRGDAGECRSIGTQNLVWDVPLTSGERGQGAVALDLTSHVMDVDLYRNDTGTYMAWITSASGKYQLFVAALEGESWGVPDLVCELDEMMTHCSMAEEGGHLLLILESDYEDGDLSVCSRQFTMTKSGHWELSEGTGALPPSEETPTGAAGAANPSSWVGILESAISSAIAKLDDCPDPPRPGPRPTPPGDVLPHKNFQSFDPNEIYGPEGAGAANWIAPGQMDFQIACENIAKDNIAHAAMVTITEQLDEAFDWSSFTLGTMMMGGQYIDVAVGLQSYRGRVDLTASLGVWVDIEAGVDLDTGLVTWSFTAIDPATGWVVSDPFTGLLAPNYNPPEGDGFVNYSIKPKDTVASGTEFKAEAEIIFDFNEPIDTPTISYTLDSEAPEAVVAELAESGSGRYIRVDWSGKDVGSGVASYDVYVSVDGGD